MTEEIQYIKIDISSDEMEATLTIKLPHNSPLPDVNEVMRAIRSNDIKAEIFEAKVREMIDNRVFHEPVVIARGTSPIPSKHGKIELLYIAQEKESDTDARVDHHERMTIKTVAKGDEIARIHPPVQGKEGMTVTGKIISPGTGKEKILKNGKNTEFSSHDKNLLLSSENGAVRFIENNKITVDPVMNIRGDVDYSVGNIDFTGALIIQGNVLSGFKVKAAGSIQIDGTVEDCEIDAGGDIIVNSCSGKTKGTLKSGGEIRVNFAVNHNLQAYGNITVTKYLMNCRTQSDGKVMVTGPKGIIVGGETIGARGIETQIAGNNEGTKTVLAVGFSSEIRQKLIMLDIEQTRNIKSLGTVNQALKRISRIAIIKKDLTSEMKEQIRELIKTREAIEERIAQLTNEQESILRGSDPTQNSYVSVKATVFPGVTIRFPNAQRMIREPISNAKFIIMNSMISLASAV